MRATVAKWFDDSAYILESLADVLKTGASH